MSGRRRRTGDSESGLTMIELLVTVSIMGIAFIVIVGGLTVAVMGSDFNRRQSSVDSWLRSSAEAVKSAPYDGDCSADVYDDDVPADPQANVVISVDVVGYWDAESNTFQAACDDTGLQLVRVSVSNSAVTRPVTQSLDVVKREP